MWKDFKAFAMKGNVFDLAIGVIIGAAFGKIVTSLVADILTPILGLLLGGRNFSGLTLQFGDAVIKYGVFLQSVIDFFIVSYSIFLFIKLLGKFKRKQEEKPAAPPAPSKEEQLLAEIRDLLKQQQGAR
ncbi:large conductance mechanosensitive channel protein MscL [Paenibacillus sp. GYB003]|uniref:large conductance mechanosensitive channel protein MscL n=1 Tax=Paenibacillus sp. GYB003 TaxID=2994392 RepID=UPI002F965535